MPRPRLPGSPRPSAGRPRGTHSRRGHLPLLVAAVRRVLRPRRDVGFELLEAEGPQDLEHEPEQRRELGDDLLARAEDVAVVLGEPARAQQAMEYARSLEAVHGAE